MATLHKRKPEKPEPEKKPVSAKKTVDSKERSVSRIADALASACGRGALLLWLVLLFFAISWAMRDSPGYYAQKLTINGRGEFALSHVILVAVMVLIAAEMTLSLSIPMFRMRMQFDKDRDWSWNMLRVFNDHFWPCNITDHTAMVGLFVDPLMWMLVCITCMHQPIMQLIMTCFAIFMRSLAYAIAQMRYEGLLSKKNWVAMITDQVLVLSLILVTYGCACVEVAMIPNVPRRVLAFIVPYMIIDVLQYVALPAQRLLMEWYADGSRNTPYVGTFVGDVQRVLQIMRFGLVVLVTRFGGAPFYQVFVKA